MIPVPTEVPLQDISHTIQLAVAPVFLLTAIGTTLSVLTTRLGRIVDRARRVEVRLSAADLADVPTTVVELRALATRARLIYLALTFGVGSALFVCLTIATAFAGYMLDFRLGGGTAVLFIAAVGCYVGALLCFLREVFMAIANLKFALPGTETPSAPSPPDGG